ncbi:hypothetical protein FAEUMB_31030 [Faecalimonas umbilicata]|uniref:Uncharacterized protein n=1 Tax=Faecalimonas umbilicata TaxID=1912855 RepID=A0ABQ0R239_9FIRM|nr:hypothetical protein FAEUMB_31030 [Faecalimonas umbilicata]
MKISVESTGTRYVKKCFPFLYNLYISDVYAEATPQTAVLRIFFFIIMVLMMVMVLILVTVDFPSDRP